MGETSAAGAFDASVVLVQQDDRELAEASAIHVARFTDGVAYQLILTDDAAAQPSEILRALTGDVRRHDHAERIGVPASWNEAAGTADGRHVVFLSTHVLPAPGWLSALVAFADAHPEVGAVASRVLTVAGAERPIGTAFASPACLAESLARARVARVLDRRSLPSAGDGCLLVRAGAFAAVGGFDPTLGPRGAVLDLCLRLHGRALRVGYEPASELVSLLPPSDASADARDVESLRRRWGVAAGTSPDALWVEGREPGESAPRFEGVPGHFCDDPAATPPAFVEIGERSYFTSTPRFLTWTAEERIRVGRYCSFARDVTIFTGGGHRTDGVSTYPFEAKLFGSSNPSRSSRTTGDTVIGSDVWVGDRAVIAGGVRVGHGAVIASGAVVFSDVPPYAIVAGNPAVVARYRFSRPIVEALLRIAWWDWPEEEIRDRLEWFFRPVAEFVAQFDARGAGDAGAARAA